MPKENVEKSATLPGSERDKSGKADDPHTASKHEAPAGVQSVQPQDPHLQGASQREQKTLLKQNVQGPATQEQEPDTPGGQHATGSKTGK